jgi:tetratricopeptide (TPR) repeat protein
MYYQRNGDYESYDSIKESIDKKLIDYEYNKTDIDYFIHSEIYKNINHGNYNMALGILMMMPVTDQNYFEILRVFRLTGQESSDNIPINADYFEDFPRLYAALFSIESGYIESYKVNLKSGLNKITKSINFFRINNDKYHLAEALFARGKAYYKSNKYQESLIDFLDVTNHYEDLGLVFEKSLSLKYSGLNLLKIGNKERALFYLKEASINFENLDNYYELAPIYEKMSIIYKELSESDLKIIYLNKAIEAYKIIGTIDKAEELEEQL